MQRLFTAATARLEDASEIAAAGQSPRCDAAELAQLATRLRAAAEEIAVLAAAAAVSARADKKDS